MSSGVRKNDVNDTTIISTVTEDDPIEEGMAAPQELGRNYMIDELSQHTERTGTSDGSEVDDLMVDGISGGTISVPGAVRQAAEWYEREVSIRAMSDSEDEGDEQR